MSGKKPIQKVSFSYSVKSETKIKRQKMHKCLAGHLPLEQFLRVSP